MSDIAIQVQGLGKRFRLGQRGPYRTFRESIMDTVTAPFRRKTAAEKEAGTFWALKDVNFEVKRGEVVGIIGRNGAGKSTLLKVLSRITKPTEGSITLHGRVGSLLEVGTGFHPELTGRENIYLNGAILGMRRAEIAKKFDEIVAFAETEKFLDTPVKHYSSGMYTRLAFAVAAHLEPEILIVDEVLAVGDAAFQKKCLGKMKDVAGQGRTVLFVSHNMSAVQALCSRIVGLANGTVKIDALPHVGIQQYLQNDAQDAKTLQRAPQEDGSPTITSGGVEVRNDDQGQCYAVFDLSIESQTTRKVTIDFRVSDRIGQTVGSASVGGFTFADMVELVPGRNEVVAEIDASRLAVGHYTVAIDLTLPNMAYYDRVENAFSFEVNRGPLHGGDRALTQEWAHGSYEIPAKRLGTTQQAEQILANRST